MGGEMKCQELFFVGYKKTRRSGFKIYLIIIKLQHLRT